jgi:hypothetical protein
MRRILIPSLVLVVALLVAACSEKPELEPIVPLLEGQTEIGRFPLSETLTRASQLAGFEARSFSDLPDGYALVAVQFEPGPEGFGGQKFVNSTYRASAASDHPAISVQQTLSFGVGDGEPLDLGIPGVEVTFEENDRARAYRAIGEDSGLLITVLKPGGPSDSEMRAAIRSLFE